MFKNNVKVIKKCQVKVSNTFTALEHSGDSWKDEHGSIHVSYRLSKSQQWDSPLLGTWAA